jgi:class 3 adenylate cyclase
MKLPKIGWFSFKLALVLFIPFLAYFLICQSVLNQHIKSAVTNDPETGLSRSLSSIKLSLDHLSENLELKASAIAENERLRRALTPPKATYPKIKILAQELFLSAQTPLFVLTDENGEVLYDTLNLVPAPTPVPTPATPTPVPPKKKKKAKKIIAPKEPEPALFSAAAWPGISQALKGSPISGLFEYEDKLYQSLSVPIRSGQKVAGALMIGIPWTADDLSQFKKSALNDMVFFHKDKVLFTSLPPSHLEDLQKLQSSSFSGTVTLSSQPFLSGEIPLLNLQQSPTARLVVFQPTKNTLTVEGDPKKNVLEWGLIFLALMLLLGIGLVIDTHRPVEEIMTAVEKMKAGDLTAPLPIGRMDDWGDLARSLKSMGESLREKDRISLILGKVVAPQAAKKILAENEYFALKGESRECTILFADLKGFNILSEHMTPPQLVEALNQYFNLINEAVFKHEGMMDKFIGDTAVAVWGAPFSHPDKEILAVRTAMEILETLKDFNIARIIKNIPPFTIGIGIHTGPVVTGNLGSEKHYDYTVIGDNLHVTSRLCAMSAPGQIIVSSQTYEKIKKQVNVKPLSPILVKGSTQPVPTYEIVEIL